MQVVSSTKT